MRYKNILALGLAATVSGWVGPALAQADPVEVSPTPGLEFEAASSYIFRFSDDVPAAEVRARASAAAADVGGRLNFVYTTVIKGFAATMSDVAVNNLLDRNPDIISVERDAVVTIEKGKPPGKGKGGGDDGGSDPPQVMDWGVDRVGGYHDGTGKTAWVIDTGIDLDHPDLNVDVGQSRNFVTRGRNSAEDGNGHGTHVAGTIAATDNAIGVVGVAAGASLVAIRVLDKNASGLVSWVIAGLEYVAANASSGDVANLSLTTLGHQTLDEAVKSVADMGIYFSLAAGNNAADANNYSPARIVHKNAFTVSAINDTDTFASFSNWGNPPIRNAAPGVKIKSTYRDGGYAELSGTSMAAPHVAGIILIVDPNAASLESLPSDGTAINDPDGDADPIAYYLAPPPPS